MARKKQQEDIGRKQQLSGLSKDEKGVDIIPSSPAIHLVNQTITALGAGQGRLIRPNKNTSITYQQAGDSMRIISQKKTKNSKEGDITTLEIRDINLLKANNKGLKKLFTFILIELNKQNYAPVIRFPLKALVDNGMYSSIDSARIGYRKNIRKLLSLMISGTYKKGKRTITAVDENLFFKSKIDNGYVSLTYNSDINIELLAQYFTLLPQFAFSLSKNGFNLIEYIFYLARQNTKSIKEKGYFNISLRTIRDYLNLPDEKDTQKHTQYIIQPIEKAIEDIENANNNLDFTITPIYNDDYQDVREWLDGYLRIELKGEFAKMFINIASKTEQAIAKKEKRTERAKIMAETKKYEHADKKQSSEREQNNVTE